MVKISLIAVVLYFLSPIAIANIQKKVIYGDDGRIQFFQVQRPEVRAVADSTAAMIPNSNLEVKSGGITKINADSFKRVFGVCSNEPFSSEPVGAMCSAFLVGRDLIATAGHCVTDESCPETSFVFSYRMSSLNQAPTEVSSSEVYRCTEVIDREQTQNQDYALVRVDRPVLGHQILTLAKSAPQAGDSLFVVGHPSGIPTKVAGGASVRSVYNGYFSANLDTYGGNSGSAVFSESTLEVVGVLVRGENDFDYDSQNQCMMSHRCADDGCRGEDVTLISYISQAIKKTN
ncbi:MAG: trypsin-like peptidase domain-containing protein [Bdellovibrionaceae bacterium]|nr:trypsin-like peptidase domain-containing protein [Pseudobdellovibrionaceae bacterium]